MKNNTVHVSHTTDLSIGSPTWVILRFAIPVIAGLLFQQFYNIIDTSVIGHFLGIHALAGVGATVSICYLFVGIGSGISSGFSLCTAKCFGADDTAGMRRRFANGLYLITVIGIVFSLITLVLSRTILVWMKTPDDIMSYSLSYIRIIFAGLPLCFLYNYFAAMIRSLGDSKTPVLILIGSSLMNVVLDILFIAAFHTGIAGAALATVLSQGLSVLLCLLHIRSRLRVLLPDHEQWLPVRSMLGELLSMGIPIGFQSSIMSIGTIVLQTAVNSMGSSLVAASTAGERIGFLFAVFFEGIGTALATFISQNLGARKEDRVKNGIISAFKIGSIYCGVSLLAVLAFGNAFMRFYLGDTDPQLLSRAHQYGLIMIIFLPAVMILNVFRYTLQSTGFPTCALTAGVLELVGRFIIAWLIIPRVGFYGACFANPLAWTLSALALTLIMIRKSRFIYYRI